MYINILLCIWFGSLFIVFVITALNSPRNDPNINVTLDVTLFVDSSFAINFTILHRMVNENLYK